MCPASPSATSSLCECHAAAPVQGCSHAACLSTALAPACPSLAAFQCLTGGIFLPKHTLQGPWGSGPAYETSLQLSWAAQPPPWPGAASGPWDHVCPRGGSAHWDGDVGVPGLPTAWGLGCATHSVNESPCGHPSLITPAEGGAEGKVLPAISPQGALLAPAGTTLAVAVCGNLPAWCPGTNCAREWPSSSSAVLPPAWAPG